MRHFGDISATFSATFSAKCIFVDIKVIKCYTFCVIKQGKKEWRHKKKRVTISLSDERYAEFEKLVKESGLTKSTLVTSWILKEIEKGQEK